MKTWAKLAAAAGAAFAGWWFFIRKSWIQVPPVGTALGQVFPATQGRTYAATFSLETPAVLFQAAKPGSAVMSGAQVAPSFPNPSAPYVVVWVESQGDAIPAASGLVALWTLS